ncbi:MAG: penicillin-binding protein 2 [Patescibacteria group bacterium]|nr:penicillin-binding protein 2 [Patescibacteria group bacterium]
MKNWRINLVFIFFILFSAVLISRLIYIQILRADFYKALAQGFLNLPEKTQVERGEIFLKNGEPLAVNKSFSLVFASPPKVKNLEETAEILSQILNLNKNFVLEVLKKEILYSPIKNRLSEEETQALKNLNLPGIYLAEEKGRYYPQETLASQVIGFLGADGIGQYGLEEYYDQILRGKSQGSNDLILTIDYNIQFQAERLLEKAKENLEIEGGQIIVLDPNSGKIIALAHFPNFNPNQYQEYASKGDLEIFRNKATRDFFEPGSVFKSITMAAGLNEELITPTTKYVDEGYVKIGGYTIYNYNNRVWGEETMTRVLENSINTGAVFVQKLLPNNIFLDYIEKFGIFEKTGIDLPESYSENKEFKKGYEINFATASFGQGIEMTPIQLARAYSAIANGGELVTPYLVENFVDANPQRRQVISQKTASQLTAMLVSVVENGSARRAKIPGYYIAMKTGTAQIAFSALGIAKPGYSEKTTQTVVGFFPAFSPQFLILIKLDNPKTRVAEYSAVPIFKDLAEYIIHQYQIPPDYNPSTAL